MDNLSTEVPVAETDGEKVYKKVEGGQRKADRARIGFIIATVAPSFLLFLFFVILPVFNMLYTSFFKWDGIGDKIFIKFENYDVLFHNGEFCCILRDPPLHTGDRERRPCLQYT